MKILFTCALLLLWGVEAGAQSWTETVTYGEGKVITGAEPYVFPDGTVHRLGTCLNARTGLQEGCTVLDGANSMKNAVTGRAEYEPDRSWAMVDNDYNVILKIKNYEECRGGKVKCLIYLDPNFGVMVTKDRTDCLAQMENAMRIMDPFLDPHDGDIRPSVWLAQVTRLRWEVWQDVKARCWRQP